MKKILFSVLTFIMMPLMISASVGLEAKVGDNYYDTLEEAILNSNSTDTIMLISNVELKETLDIKKTVNINLNGNNITSSSTVFKVQGGVLNISGNGTIKELEPNYGAIRLIGSEFSTDTEYSIVKVGKNVTLEGWAGIFITHENAKSYGVVVKLEGKINAVDDVSGGNGAGIYVNGNIKHKDNYPVINISDSAIITSTGAGIYNAGYAILNIGKATIEGVDSGIAIKSGILNIDGTTITSTGKDLTPTIGNNNGVEASGTAIQIESNSGYAGGIELNISSGNLTSKNSYVIYEYIGKGNNSLVNSINLSGGTYISEVNKEALMFSNSFKTKHTSFISGGKYSSDPSEYLKSGYLVSLENNLYYVLKNTLKEVNSNSFNYDNRTTFFKTLIILFVIGVLSVFMYLNKEKIFNFFKNIKK